MEGSHHAREKIESIVFALYSPFPLLLTVKSTPPKNMKLSPQVFVFFGYYKSHWATSLASFGVPLPPIVEWINFPASLLFVLCST